MKECSKYVVAALCTDFRYIIYGFDKDKTKIQFSYFAYIFLVKYAYIIGKLNYFEWIKFLEALMIRIWRIILQAVWMILRKGWT